MQKLLTVLLSTVLFTGCATCPKSSDVYTQYTEQAITEVTKVVAATLNKELAEFKPKILNVDVGFSKKYGSCTMLAMVEATIPVKGFYMQVKQIFVIELLLTNNQWKITKVKTFPVSAERLSDTSS